ncbi:MAG: hypothetical protein IT158_07595 [Bryobacterales bacterium]|nr:hypothetical protein [Bryobacterales bacterium]
MSAPALFVVVAFALTALYFLARVVVPAFLKHRGKRLITCPENQAPAAVEVDAMHAAVTTGLGHTVLQLNTCSRWPERRDCGQECLSQIAASPTGCLVRSTASQWYQGQSCVFCGKAFGEIHWMEHQPALLGPDGRTVKWSDVRAETLPEVLATHKPVCWNCHIVETLRTSRPELVAERPWKQ